jgi:class 3 adenylate cyclase
MDWLFDSEWKSFEEKYGKAGVVVWHFDVQLKRSELWPYIADTSRFNRSLQSAERFETEKDGQLYIKEKVIGITQEWIEDPWSWIAEQRMLNQRRFLRGMFRYIRAGFELEDHGQGTRFTSTFGYIPRNFFYGMIIKIGFGRLQKQFAELLQKIEKLHKSSQNAIQTYAKISPRTFHVSDGAQFRIEEYARKLLAKGLSKPLLDKLIHHIKTADDLDLNKIRIVALAREWKVDEKELLILAMHATREGLLRLSWDLVCPHCRSAREKSDTLEAVSKGGYCAVCDVKFSSQDPNSVEINFRVQPSVRQVTEAVFCAAEAAKKDHIKIQLSMKPGETWQGQVGLVPGFYRLRWIGEAATYRFEVSGKNGVTGLIQWDGKNSQVVEEPYGKASFQITNSFQGSRLFILEQMWWTQDILTPAKIFSLPEFRDLFSHETLGVETILDVGEQAILFTDIVGSTEFYEKSGDSLAFVAVHKHFEEIFNVIKEHNGVVVKTIGDAVMAAFNDPLDSLRASFAMQERFKKTQEKMSGIRIRISAHTGPVLAVRLNSPIDYFGVTVNFTAKLQALVGAHEIVMSEKLYETYKNFFKDNQLPVIEKDIQIAGRAKIDKGYVVRLK